MAQSIQSRTEVFSAVSQIIAQNMALPEAVLVPTARNSLRLYNLLTDYAQSTTDLFTIYQSKYSEPLDAHRISSHLIAMQKVGTSIERKVERSGFPSKHLSYWRLGEISHPRLCESAQSEPIAIVAELLQDGVDLLPIRKALAYSAQSALEIYSLLSPEPTHSLVIAEKYQAQYSKRISYSLVQNTLQQLARHGAPIVKTQVPSAKLRGGDMLYWSINTKYVATYIEHVSVYV